LISVLVFVFSSIEVTTQGYYTGNFPISLNLYSFNVNINAWVHDRKGTPPLDTLSAIRWAKEAGFDSVNIPFYYIPGYTGDSMPTKPTDEIRSFVHQIKALAAELQITISGTGIGNNFANSDLNAVELDVQRALFWIDMAAEMGAPFIRVFSGPVPSDLDASGGWEAVSKARIVPALQRITNYAQPKGVKIGLQNHGDMTSTAEQTIQMLEWVGSDNIFIVDDTGYFRPFRAPTGLDYDWYSDINKVLPYSGDFQVKLKPAGADQEVMMDFHKLFTGLRSSPYRLPLNLERLWDKDAPDNPKDQPTVPTAQVAAFLSEVKVALEDTKIPPQDRF